MLELKRKGYDELSVILAPNDNCSSPAIFESAVACEGAHGDDCRGIEGKKLILQGIQRKCNC